MNEHDQRPTGIRYLVVFVTFLAALLLYLHRFCISYMQRYIREDLALSNWEFSFCFSAFFLSYALAQVPSGWLSDRYGARATLTLYILVWSLFTALTGLVTGFLMLLAVRLGTGLGQAGAYPTSAGLIGRWVPLRARGRANSIVAFGGRLGAGVAPFLTAMAVIWFVPPSVSPEVREADLLDVHYLSYRMFEHSPEVAGVAVREPAEPAPANRVAVRIRNRLSDTTQSMLRRMALDYAGVLAEANAEKAPLAEESGPDRYQEDVQRRLEPASPETRETLAAELSRILQADLLFSPERFPAISIEREAERLFEQADDLSTPERKRLNRLLLEAVFPNSIRKLYVHGWRQVLWLYGAAGIVVAALFWISCRNWPARHPGCNAAEVELIEKGRPPTDVREHDEVQAVPLREILKSRSLWLMCVNQWGGNVGWVFLVTWLPRYLLEVHSAPLEQRGVLASIPLWAGWAGMLAGGVLTDRVTRRFGLRWRTVPIVFGRLAAMTAYLFCLLHPSVWTVTAVFAIVAFSNDLCNPASWAYKQDVGGRYVSSVHGWANMWGNLGATVSPVLLQAIIGEGNWDGAFLTCAAAFLIAALAALFVDARIPIVPPEEPPSTRR